MLQVLTVDDKDSPELKAKKVLENDEAGNELETSKSVRCLQLTISLLS